MSVRGRGCSKMPCESCAVQFSVFRRKRACTECERYYCAGCLRRGGGAMCAPCRALSTRPLQRPAIAHLKVRDLQCFLQRQNVSTRGCVEKEELVSLCVAHVNSAAYRRRAPRAPFPSLKGITTNINDFINNTFDLRPAPPAARPPPAPAPARPAPNRDDCFNAAHAHVPRRERFTATPDGQERISVPVPAPAGGAGAGGAGAGGAGAGGAGAGAGAGGALVDTADCFEVEDLDDAGWEFVRRPADPLPNDSDVLLSTPDSWQPRTPLRASSSLELRSLSRAASPAADRVSLQDEPAPAPAHPVPAPPAPPSPPSPPPPPPPADGNDSDTNISSPATVALEELKELSQLEALGVRQMKELLVRNRVEVRGCLERDDLLARARRLWRDHARHRDQVESLPLEECCKICMAAPLECVLLECGHIAACTRCAKQLAECPICRQYVVRAVRFFRS